MEMSIAVMTSSTTLPKVAASKVSSDRRNFSRLMEARLQEELSRLRYSLQGLLAVMRPVSGLVCQSLMVSSYCRPGSAHSQAALAIVRNSVRASTDSSAEPSSRARSAKSRPSSTACMNSSLTRTELLAFWYWIDLKPSPSIDMSNPASRSAAALSSSLALHQMNSRMSGWSTSSTTIFAARRVLPPDLIVPAHESAPRMNETGPDAVPPLASGSIEPRMFDRLIPEPEPPRKIIPSLVFHSRLDSIVSSTLRMKQLWTATLLERYSPDSVWMS